MRCCVYHPSPCTIICASQALHAMRCECALSLCCIPVTLPPCSSPRKSSRRRLRRRHLYAASLVCWVVICSQSKQATPLPSCLLNLFACADVRTAKFFLLIVGMSACEAGRSAKKSTPQAITASAHMLACRHVVQKHGSEAECLSLQGDAERDSAEMFEVIGEGLGQGQAQGQGKPQGRGQGTGQAQNRGGGQPQGRVASEEDVGLEAGTSERLLGEKPDPDPESDPGARLAGRRGRAGDRQSAGQAAVDSNPTDPELAARGSRGGSRAAGRAGAGEEAGSTVRAEASSERGRASSEEAAQPAMRNSETALDAGAGARAASARSAGAARHGDRSSVVSGGAGASLGSARTQAGLPDGARPEAAGAGGERASLQSLSSTQGASASSGAAAKGSGSGSQALRDGAGAGRAGVRASSEGSGSLDLELPGLEGSSKGRDRTPGGRERGWPRVRAVRDAANPKDPLGDWLDGRGDPEPDLANPRPADAASSQRAAPAGKQAGSEAARRSAALAASRASAKDDANANLLGHGTALDDRGQGRGGQTRGMDVADDGPLLRIGTEADKAAGDSLANIADLGRGESSGAASGTRQGAARLPARGDALPGDGTVNGAVMRDPDPVRAARDGALAAAGARPAFTSTVVDDGTASGVAVANPVDDHAAGDGALPGAAALLSRGAARRAKHGGLSGDAGLSDGDTLPGMPDGGAAAAAAADALRGANLFDPAAGSIGAAVQRAPARLGGDGTGDAIAGLGLGSQAASAGGASSVRLNDGATTAGMGLGSQALSAVEAKPDSAGNRAAALGDSLLRLPQRKEPQALLGGGAGSDAGAYTDAARSGSGARPRRAAGSARAAELPRRGSTGGSAARAAAGGTQVLGGLDQVAFRDADEPGGEEVEPESPKIVPQRDASGAQAAQRQRPRAERKAGREPRAGAGAAASLPQRREAAGAVRGALPRPGDPNPVRKQSAGSVAL